MTYYDYAELLTAATAPGADQAEVNALGEWFEQYGAIYWNSEYFDAGDGLRLYRIEEWDDECDQGKIIGYEFK